MPNLPGDRENVESPQDDLLRQIEREKNLKRAQLAALGLGPKDPQAIDTSNWDRNYLIQFYAKPGSYSGD